MFYIAGPEGFLVIRNTPKGTAKTVFVTDVREATVFPTFDAAEAEARSRIKPTVSPYLEEEAHYYTILNTGWRPDRIAATPHHFDVRQEVKIVRGPHDLPMPDVVRDHLNQIGVVRGVDLFLNTWTYAVEIDSEEFFLTANHLAQVTSNSQIPEEEEKTEQAFTLYWRTGKRQVVRGLTAGEAMTAAGYSAGALSALDFYAHGDNHEYTWSDAEKDWVKNVSEI